MNTTYPPYASTPAADYYYDKKEYVSPSPTPSPRGPTYYHGTAQQRPATRAHFRHMSSGGATGTPSSGPAGIYHEYAGNSSSSRPPTFSPRYTSDGHYATANVSSSRSAQKHTTAATTTHATTTGPRRGRSASFSYYRASDSIGESDEDELVKIDGVTYLLPARSARRSGPVRISGGNHSPSHSRKYSQGYADYKGYQDYHHYQDYQDYQDDSQDYRHSYRYETNHPHYKQGGFGFVEKDAGPGFESPRFRDAREVCDSRERDPVIIEPRRTTPTGPTTNAAHAAHIRRSSTAMPTNVHMHARPQTARPSSSHFQGPPPPTTTSSRKPSGAPPATTTAATGTPPPRAATEADAKKYHIPAGYSLKNWDPSEEPIMLLGSVFDANSLGKWIYDWTTYHHGPQSPISEIAGELWLLLIQLAGKIKRTDDVMPRVRTRENREMLEDFIISGERLTDKLRKLLKTCEAPMMHVASSKRSKAQPQLGKGAGIEFVETMFGREREMEKTERFMQSVRLWNLRFDANCEDILRKPTQ